MDNLTILSKVNKFAKYYGREKKAAYDAGDHEKAQYCKFMEKILYVLKSLSIAQFVSDGLLVKGGVVKDSHGTSLTVFTSEGGHVFHSLSCREVGDSDIVTLNSRYALHGYCLPFMRYLTRRLDREKRDLFYLLWDEDFCFNYNGRVSSRAEAKLVDLSEKLGVTYQCTKHCMYVDYTYEYWMDLYMDGARIGEITIGTRTLITRMQLPPTEIIAWRRAAIERESSTFLGRLFS